jgi:hypothetical protein
MDVARGDLCTDGPCGSAIGYKRGGGGGRSNINIFHNSGDGLSRKENMCLW